MNEVITTEAGYMYDEVPAIQNLNRVDGFDPRRYMRLIGNEGQPGKFYLDVAYRKLWFRLKYPEGKIVKRILKLTDQVAIVEARVYLNRNDAEDQFIANAFAQKYRTADEQFGNKFVELAETAAVGRALADAGFGPQFADIEGDMDPEVTDAPLKARIVMDDTNQLSGDTFTEESFEAGVDWNDYTVSGAGSDFADVPDNVTDEVPGQLGIASYVPMSNSPEKAASQLIKQMAPKPPVQQSRQSGQSSAVHPVIQKDMPIEQIYTMLTMETAAAVVVNIGYNKGKTLGQVAIEKPASLDWYVSSYEGPDNLLRAAAKYLMDAALCQAS